MNTPTSLTRRQIAKLLAALAALPAWPRAASAAAAGPATRRPAPRPRTPQESPPPGLEGLVEYVRANFGDRLDEEQVKEITAQIARRLQGSALADYRLENHDEPGFLFRVFRAD